MLKKILQLLIVLFFFLLTNNKVYAKDFFPQLEALKIYDILPQNLMQQSEIIENDNSYTIYLRFESGSFSYPHYVEIDSTNDQIIYIELKIPETHIEVYQNYLSSLGEPETEEIKTHSFILLGYPSKGIGFIVANTSENFMLFTQYPVETVEELRANEAKNFIPVPQIPTAPAITSAKLISSQENMDQIFQITPTVTIGVTAIIVGITVGIVIIKKRRRKKSKENDLPPSPPQMNS